MVVQQETAWKSPVFGPQDSTQACLSCNWPCGRKARRPVRVFVSEVFQLGSLAKHGQIRGISKPFFVCYSLTPRKEKRLSHLKITGFLQGRKHLNPNLHEFGFHVSFRGCGFMDSFHSETLMMIKVVEHLFQN